MNFWFAAGPLATAICGYLPGKRLRFGAGLPGGVFWQWRRWSVSRGVCEAGYGPRMVMPHWTSDASARLHAYSDDDLTPTHCVWRLARNYAGAAEVVRVEPKDHGLDAIERLSAVSRKKPGIVAGFAGCLMGAVEFRFRPLLPWAPDGPRQETMRDFWRRVRD